MKSLPSIVFAILIVLSATAQSLVPPKVTLAWDAEPATNNVASYKIYWGTTTRTYTNSLPTPTNSVTVSNLAYSTTYFFASTAIGTNGLESTYSSEVFTNTPPVPQFPPPPPTTLRIITGP